MHRYDTINVIPDIDTPLASAATAPTTAMYGVPVDVKACGLDDVAVRTWTGG